jgi:hypothetical protein
VAAGWPAGCPVDWPVDWPGGCPVGSPVSCPAVWVADCDANSDEDLAWDGSTITASGRGKRGAITVATVSLPATVRNSRANPIAVRPSRRRVLRSAARRARSGAVMRTVSIRGTASARAAPGRLEGRPPRWRPSQPSGAESGDGAPGAGAPGGGWAIDGSARDGSPRNGSISGGSIGSVIFVRSIAVGRLRREVNRERGRRPRRGMRHPQQRAGHRRRCGQVLRRGWGRPIELGDHR